MKQFSQRERLHKQTNTQKSKQIYHLRLLYCIFFSIVFDFLFIYTASFHEKHNNKSLFSLLSLVFEFGRKYGIFEKKKKETAMSGVKAEQKHPADCRSLALQAFFQKKKKEKHTLPLQSKIQTLG